MTDGAVLACRLARLRAGRLDCRVDHFRMASRGDHFRLGLSAHCAGVGLDAGILTGGLDCDLALVPTMALRRDHFALLDHRTADGALLSICQTSFRTGCCLTGNRHRSVLLHGNHFLRNDDRMTDGAVLAFRQAGRSAGRLNRLVDHFRVTSLCKLSLFRCCASITGARFLARCCAACGSCYCPFAPAVA